MYTYRDHLSWEKFKKKCSRNFGPDQNLDKIWNLHGDQVKNLTRLKPV